MHLNDIHGMGMVLIICSQAIHFHLHLSVQIFTVWHCAHESIRTWKHGRITTHGRVQTNMLLPELGMNFYLDR